MDTIPLNLTDEQLEIIRANSISAEAYQSTLNILRSEWQMPSSPRSIDGSVKPAADLGQSLTHFSIFLESIPNALVVYDNQGQVTYVNSIFSKTFGWPLEEIVGGRLNFVPESHRQETLKQLESLFKGQPFVNFTSQRYTKSNQLLDVDISAGRLNAADGQLLGIVVILRQVTEGKNAVTRAHSQIEESLRDREQLLQLVLDNIPQAVFWKDCNLVYQGCNKLFAKDSGLESPELVVGKTDYDFPWTKEEADYFIKIDNQVITNNEAALGVIEPQRLADGSQAWVETNVIPLHNSDGKVIGILGTYQNVTTRIEAQQQLEASEAQFKALIDGSLVGIYILQDGYFKYVNGVAEELVGYSREELFSRPALDFVHKDDVHLVAENIRRRMSGEIDMIHYNLRFVKKDGEILQLEVRGAITEHEGKPAILGSLVDITNNQKAAAERERLSQILESTTDFVGITDLEGNVTYLNTAAKQMIGLDLEDAVDHLTIASFTPQSISNLLFDEAIPTSLAEGVWQGETALLHRDGHEIPVSQVIITNKSPDGEAQYISTIIRDITDQKEAEAQTRLRLELSEALTNTRTEQEIIEAIISKAGYYSKVAVAITHFVERDGQMFNKTVHQHIFESTLIPAPIGAEIPLAPNVWELLKNNQPFISNKVEDDERLPVGLREFSKNTNIIGLAIFPISIEGQPYGSLVAITGEEYFFDNAKVNLYRSLAEQGSLSLRSAQLNKRIEESLNRRSRQVQITTQISQEIASSTEIYELYQRVVELIKEEFNYYHTQLLQYNPALDAVALVVGYGEIGQRMLEMGHAMPLGTGIIGTAAESGEAVLRSDVSKEPNWRPNALLPNTKGELALPIKLRNQVIGVLDIQSDVVGQLTQEDQIMLEGLCGQIAIAIESTRLRQDMNERLAELSNLQRLMTREGWQTFQNNNQYQSSGYLFERNNLVPLDVTQNGGSNGTKKQNKSLSSEDEKTVSNSITIRGEVIGTFGLEDSSENPLTREDEDLLNAISLQVAEALENARLIEQTRKRAIELETVARVSANTSTILESEQLLQSVVNLTQSSFGLYHAHVYLLSDDRHNLTLVAGTGEVGHLMVAENWQVPVYDQTSPVARVSRIRRGMVISDIRQEPKYQPNPLMPETKAELVVPMIAGDELLGVLDLHSSTVGFFTEEDLRIHTTLATQIAIALQNANLYQEQLETAEKLREFDRLKSQFLASMSHELRTPLNSIIGFADVLLEGIDGELNERMREDVMLIRDGGQHLRALIGDILDMSKIEAGMMDLTYNRIDLGRIANEVIATTQGLVKDKSINLILDMEENLGPIEADRTRLVQILLNLLSNAAKFTDEGSIVLSLHRHSHNFLLVGVKDSGIGIKEEDIAQVFEQFRQIGGMEHRKAGGTGLGMPITKQLVELHGGKIWIESIYGSGTTFWFTLPFERPAELEANKREGYYT